MFPQTKIPYILTKSSLSFSYKGKATLVSKEHILFPHLKESLAKDKNDTSVITAFADPYDYIKIYSEGKVVSEHDLEESDTEPDLIFRGEVYPHCLNQFLLFGFKKLPLKPLIKFYNKVKQNFNLKIQEDIWEYVHINGCPISQVGNLLILSSCIDIPKTKFEESVIGSSEFVSLIKLFNLKDLDSRFNLPYFRCSHANFWGDKQEDLLELEVDPRFIARISTNIIPTPCARVVRVVRVVTDIDLEERVVYINRKQPSTNLDNSNPLIGYRDLYVK